MSAARRLMRPVEETAQQITALVTQTQHGAWVKTADVVAILRADREEVREEVVEEAVWYCERRHRQVRLAHAGEDALTLCQTCSAIEQTIRETVERACRAVCFKCSIGTPLVEGGHLHDDGGKNLPWFECPAEAIRRAFEGGEKRA